jgi:hypothetical protein
VPRTTNICGGLLLVCLVPPVVSGSRKDTQTVRQKQFERAAKEWAAHCKAGWTSSNSAYYLNHPAYRRLVRMGRPIVPLAMERYRNPDDPAGTWWGFLLEDITGQGFIPDRNNFDPAAVRERWLEWWARNKNR